VAEEGGESFTSGWAGHREAVKGILVRLCESEDVVYPAGTEVEFCERLMSGWYRVRVADREFEVQPLDVMLKVETFDDFVLVYGVPQTPDEEERLRRAVKAFTFPESQPGIVRVDPEA
jgi:hypothetical protein